MSLKKYKKTQKSKFDILFVFGVQFIMQNYKSN